MTAAPEPAVDPFTAAAQSRRGLLALFGLIEILIGAACFGLLLALTQLIEFGKFSGFLL